MMGRQVDIVETSRGCTYDCSFCSIIEMRAGISHVVDRSGRGDIRMRTTAARDRSFWSTTTSPERRAIPRALPRDPRAGSTRSTIVQGMTSAIASGGDELGQAMRDAGFRMCSSASRTCSMPTSRF